jgi:hypothetical protein
MIADFVSHKSAALTPWRFRPEHYSDWELSGTGQGIGNAPIPSIEAPTRKENYGSTYEVE